MLAQLALMLVIAVTSGAAGYWLARRRRRLLGPLVAFGVVVLGVSVVPRLLPTELYFLFPTGPFGETALASAFPLSGALAGAYRDTAFRIILQVILAPLMVYFVLGSTRFSAVPIAAPLLPESRPPRAKPAGSTERKEATHSTQVAAPQKRAAGNRLA